MAKGFNIYLDPTESCSQADIEAMCKAINPPVGWERFPNNNGIGVYAANVFDPHIDMDEYLCNISDYLNAKNSNSSVEATLTWGGDSSEIYLISKDDVKYAGEDADWYAEQEEIEEHLEKVWAVDAMGVVDLRRKYEGLCDKNVVDMDVSEHTALLKEMADTKKELLRLEKEFIEKFGSDHDEFNSCVTESNRLMPNDDLKYHNASLFEDMNDDVSQVENEDQFEL